MNAKHGLTPKVVRQIVDVLAGFPHIDEAVLFGSRAKGVHKPGSDIDLGLSGRNLDWRIVSRVASALDDLPVPYRFSTIVLNERTDADVAAHIRRVGIPLFKRDPVMAR